MAGTGGTRQRQESEHEFTNTDRFTVARSWRGRFDDTVGMAPMVTLRQVQEHRINSIG